MASQSLAFAPSTLKTPKTFPSRFTAKISGLPPESSWVQKISGWWLDAASPDGSLSVWPENFSALHPVRTEARALRARRIAFVESHTFHVDINSQPFGCTRYWLFVVGEGTQVTYIAGDLKVVLSYQDASCIGVDFIFTHL